MILKNIKEFTENWKTAISERVAANHPRLLILQVGDNEASNRYVRNKIKDCKEIGIEVELKKFDEDVKESTFLYELVTCAYQYSAIMVQLPLPPQINERMVALSIPPYMDVDGFNPASNFNACTALGIMKYLKYCDFDLTGKNVVIIGRSNIVGKPLARLMTAANATVTLCHSKTKNIWDFIENADLIVTAVGKEKFLNCYPIYVPVIDVGINFDENGKMVGDCCNIDNRDVTPVPGGVGLLTRCALLENVSYTKYED